MHTVVGAVDDDRVLGDAEFVEVIQHVADTPIMFDHAVVVLGLPDAGLAEFLGGDVGAEVHPGRVEPHEERGVGFDGVVDEPLGFGDDLVVDRLHALLGERAGVLDATVGVAVDHTARTESFTEVREILLVRVVTQLGLFFGIEVVQVAEELVEAVVRRQELVAISEVVLAELCGGVTLRFEGASDRRVFTAHAEIGPRHPDLGQTRAIWVLPTHE